ncbi:hypothetical protein V7S43_001520 [Phytophthora oleae]|uniref:Protein kinase domain-containing protein n=1 Tax=Phytophthora oleae TaxID=2107226 RepID=A0ABD3G3W5_9STRA
MARRGICSSPLSSADEAETPAFPELSPSPLVKSKTHSKRKLKVKTALQSKKPKNERKSTKELVQDAPLEFVEYLAEQLSIVQQTKFETEFGGGQGYIFRLPTSRWKTKRKRDELESWIRLLGFNSGATLSHNALRVASLKADVICSELKKRLPSVLSEEDKEEDVEIPQSFGESGDGESAKGDSGERPSEGYATDPAMIRLKQYFQKLESQKLEVVSYSENHRQLSSTQHMAIADAMEDVLAQPSVRRDRRLARRLSKLGRISGRRLSSMGPSSSSFLPPVEDDWVWDQEMDKMSLTPVKRRISLGERASICKKNVLGESVLRIVLHSGLVDVKTLKEVLRKVSAMWEKIAVMAYAWTIADYSKKINLYSAAQLYSRHPRGHYLADGAYKKVFKVFSSEQKRLEAISVMDIGEISNTGNQDVIRQEVIYSILLTDATEHGVCPNFLRIYDVFLAHEQPRPDRWGSKMHRKPTELLADTSNDLGAVQQQNSPPSGESERLFQYIRMEFCDGGDLEDFISLQENKNLPLDSVAVPFFFQMVFSLYCARERFNLRHCDIKLLNFFLKDIGRANLNKAPGADVVLHYMLEDACFVLQMPASFSYWVKLADYGAADSNLDNLGKPVTIDQFATLENSPIEFLLEGDAAEQSYAADTFSLGLCLLHLFTGSAPYEEILEDVHCPEELLKDLKFVWMSPRKNSGFSVIKSVARGDDEETLCHTLYRFIVLFGLPEKNPIESKNINKVWRLLLKHLRPEDSAMYLPQRRSRRAAGTNKAQLHAKTTKDQFDHDQSLYSIASGSNEIIYRCRDGLRMIPDAMDLLLKLVDFDPSNRPTLKQVLYHPMFSSLRSPFKQKEVAADYVVSYYKSRGQGGHAVLDV